MSKVKIGKKIPAFTSTLDDGSEIKSNDLIGKNIVIYFIQKTARQDVQKKVKILEIFIKNLPYAMRSYLVFLEIQLLRMKNLKPSTTSHFI